MFILVLGTSYKALDTNNLQRKDNLLKNRNLGPKSIMDTGKFHANLLAKLFPLPNQKMAS